MRAVYLDYNGSAPLDPRVAEIMVPILMEGIGNASSIHRFGRQQNAAVDEAREHVAAMVGRSPFERRVHGRCDRSQQSGSFEGRWKALLPTGPGY